MGPLERTPFSPFGMPTGRRSAGHGNSAMFRQAGIRVGAGRPVADQRRPAIDADRTAPAVRRVPDDNDRWRRRGPATRRRRRRVRVRRVHRQRVAGVLPHAFVLRVRQHPVRAARTYPFLNSLWRANVPPAPRSADDIGGKVAFVRSSFLHWPRFLYTRRRPGGPPKTGTEVHAPVPR